MKPKILIIENEPAIADTIRYALETEGFEPVWCATGEEGLAQLQAQSPALSILDIGLPDMNGFEVFKRAQALSTAPIIFLTARSDEIDRVVGLELGADDYIAKPFSPRELVARIRTILRRSNKAGGPAQGFSMVCPAALQIDEERRAIRFYGQLLDLSRYEYGLLKTLITRPGRVYPRDELLALVWDEPGESTDRTVDAHIKMLRAKLKLIAPGVEAIRTHRGTGYALEENLPAAPS